jgi:hypothetical protein
LAPARRTGRHPLAPDIVDVTSSPPRNRTAHNAKEWLLPRTLAVRVTGRHRAGGIERGQIGCSLRVGGLRHAHIPGTMRFLSNPANIEAVLSSRYLFHCRQAGVRLPDSERAAVAVAVGHLLTQPHGRHVEWAPPSLRSVYERSDGAALFCPDGTTIDDLGVDYGIILHSVDEVFGATERLREWLLSDLEDLRDEFEPAEFDKAHKRIGSFVAIGSKCSGDPVVLDRSASTDSEEIAVLILDHELLISAALDDTGELVSVHRDVLAFLTAVHVDALTYLDDFWCYRGPDGRQYFVESIEHAP